MDTATQTPEFVATYGYDYDIEDPTVYSPLKLISFSKRHTAYENPDPYLACSHEDDEGYECDIALPYHQGPEFDHEWQPPADKWNVPLRVLSYFEHGSSRWMDEGDYTGFVSRFDTGSWDTVRFAGILVANPEWEAGEDAADYLDGLNADAMGDIVAAYLDEMNCYHNGEVYWCAIDRVVPQTTCPCCGQPTNDGRELIDSCAGLVGYDALQEYITATLRPYGEHKLTTKLDA